MWKKLISNRIISFDQKLILKGDHSSYNCSNNEILTKIKMCIINARSSSTIKLTFSNKYYFKNQERISLFVICNIDIFCCNSLNNKSNENNFNLDGIRRYRLANQHHTLLCYYLSEFQQIEYLFGFPPDVYYNLLYTQNSLNLYRWSVDH